MRDEERCKREEEIRQNLIVERERLNQYMRELDLQVPSPELALLTAIQSHLTQAIAGLRLCSGLHSRFSKELTRVSPG